MFYKLNYFCIYFTNRQMRNENYSLKELLTLWKIYLGELRSKKQWLFAFLMAGVLYGFYHKFTNPKIYEAELSFMINEDQSKLGGMSAILGQFGGLIGDQENVNLYKILELGRSRQLAERVFFQKIGTEKGDSVFLANRMIESFEHQGLWAKSAFYKPDHPLKNFRFKSGDPGQFGLLENRALLELHQLFLGMLTTYVSDKTNIMQLQIHSTDELLAEKSANSLFEEMSDYYIDKTLEKQLATYQGLQHKTDSLRSVLEKKQYGLAGLKDSYRAAWLYQEEVPKDLLDQDIHMLRLVYAEAMKNKEVASFSLSNKTPFIQAIDKPILPLKSKESSWPKSLLIGIILGCFTGAAFIIIRKISLDSIQ